MRACIARHGEDGWKRVATIDQAAATLALLLGAVGSLLLIVWQSR